MKFKNLRAEISNEKVLKKLNCTAESSLYEDFLEEFLEIKEEALGKIHPQCAMAFGSLPGEAATEELPEGTPVVYVISSIGNEISRYIEQYFQEGDYVKGMLADALADTYLFELEKCWGPKLIHSCREKGVGIAKRLEIPEELPLTIQRAAYTAIGPEELPGMDLSDAYMFYPVKSICHVFLLSEDKDTFAIEHNCRICSNVQCNMRDVQAVEILVHGQGQIDTVSCEGSEHILEALQKIYPDCAAVCGKKGLCGKCRIRVLSGMVPPSRADKEHFSALELEKGWRLSCKAYPLGDCEIELSFEDGDYEVLTAGENVPFSSAEEKKETSYGIVVDIGTTTLAAQLLELSSGQIEATTVSVNHQRAFGADVISRIQASNEGKKEELRQSIQNDLLEMTIDLLKQKGIEKERVRKISIAGNTTMEHLLMGYSCEKMGRMPFHPFRLDYIKEKAGEVLGSRGEKLLPNAEVSLLPGISAFVGADIAAGLFSCGFDRKEEICFLLDLGTNGEMAIGNKKSVYVTSTAAGPAFEGGNIKWGTGSVPGAICHVTIERETPIVQTIGGKAPCGICGTGVLEAIAELLRCGLMDETGRLDSRYGEKGYPLAQTELGEMIVLTQRDIREIQLAKAAIRAGMEVLMKKYGCSWEQIHRLYLAGGFGYQVDQKKAAAIGLLPSELLDRVEVIGNSSLTGARMCLLESGAEERIEQIRRVSREIPLAAEKDFRDLYMDSMYFEE